MKKTLILLLSANFCINGYSLETKDTESLKQVTKFSKKKKTLKDYGAGFKMFYKFGLPNVKDAKYVKLEMRYSGWPFDHIRTKSKIKGNAWLLSFDKKTGVGTFVTDQAGVLKVTDSQKAIEDLQKKAKEESNTPSEKMKIKTFTLGADQLTGTWKTADLKEDADNLIKYFENFNDNEYYVTSLFGNYFLFAVHLYSKGMKDEANQLAELLFKLGKGKKKIILQAFNALANAQYKAAYEQFKSDKDWKKFGSSLDSILKRFQKSWSNRPGVEKLSKMVHKNIEGNLNLPSSLTEEEKNLIKGLDNYQTPVFCMDLNTLWSIKSANKNKSNLTSKEDDAISKITSRGMDSVPLLISLLGNEHLTSVDKSTLINFHTSYFFSYDNGDQVDESYTKKIFNKLQRPATLGEVAKYLLKKVINKAQEVDGPDNDIFIEEKNDLEEFKTAALKWYNEFKDKSDKEKAIIYLETGNKKQKTQAVSYLLNNKIKSAYKDIEAFLLETPRPKYDNDFKDKLAVKYTGMRGKEAKEFAEKYLKLVDPDGTLQEQLKKSASKKKKNKQTVNEKELVLDDKTVNKWETRRLLKLIEELKEFITSKSIEEILNDLSKSDKELDKKEFLMQVKRLKLSDKTPEEKEALILKFAIQLTEKGKGKDSALALQQVTSIFKPQTAADFMFLSNSSDEDYELPKPGKNKELWNKLFSSKIKCNTEENKILPETIGDYALMCAENLYNKPNKNSKKLINIDTVNSYLYTKLGQKYIDLLKERNQARFNGTPENKLKPVPTLKGLSKEEIKKESSKIAAQLAKSKDLKKAVSNLNSKDMLYLYENLSKNEQLNKKLLKLANKITTISVPFKDGKFIQELKGKELNGETVEQIRAYILKKASEGKNIYCRILRKPILEGVSITITEQPTILPKNKNLLLEGTAVYGFGNTIANWNLTDQKQQIKNSEKNNSDEFSDLFSEMEEDINEDSENEFKEQQTEFLKATTNALQTAKTTNALEGILITFKQVSD